VIVSGIHVIDAAHLIPFKAKAWLDLTHRKTKGEQVDSKNIHKHLNDIIRLSALLSPDTKKILPDSVAGDMARFMTEVDGS
jgi:hypothetical protein